MATPRTPPDRPRATPAPSFHAPVLRLSDPLAEVLGVLEPGATFTYEFVAKNAGSHMYHSHHNAAAQVTKGLLGAFIIEPKDKSKEPKFDSDYVMILNDTGIGLTINGRSFPDSIAGNYASWLPFQPYGALVWIEGDQDPNNLGLPALIRYANDHFEQAQAALRAGDFARYGEDASRLLALAPGGAAK